MTAEIINDYQNTELLLKKFPVKYPTHVEPGIGERIQNRLLTGFENWNRGYDAWEAWGNILYTTDSIYNVHGARLTLKEYQAAMNVALKQVDIKMGGFHNMIICDDWCAIRYDMKTIVNGIEKPGMVMEFVKFKDYGRPLGTRVVEGWGAPKDEGYKGMAAFRGPESSSIQQKQDVVLMYHTIPDTTDLIKKYPVLYPTTPFSNHADEIRMSILKEFDAWNKGYDTWKNYVDTFFDKDLEYTDSHGKVMSLTEYKDSMKEDAGKVERLYFDSMLINGEWAAIHYRIRTNKTEVGDRMQFLHFIKKDDSIKVDACWTE